MNRRQLLRAAIAAPFGGALAALTATAAPTPETPAPIDKIAELGPPPVQPGERMMFYEYGPDAKTLDRVFERSHKYMDAIVERIKLSYIVTRSTCEESWSRPAEERFLCTVTVTISAVVIEHTRDISRLEVFKWANQSDYRH